MAITLTGSLLVGFGNSFSLLVIGRIISGIGALTIAIVAPQTLSQWFKKGDLGKAMGIFNTAMPLGTILTLNSFGFMAAALGWRVPILLTSVYCMLVLILFYFKYPSPPEEIGSEERQRPKLKSTGDIREVVAYMVIAGIWMMQCFYHILSYIWRLLYFSRLMVMEVFCQVFS